MQSFHPLVFEVGDAGLNGLEDVARIVVELDDSELGGWGTGQPVHQGQFTRPAGRWSSVVGYGATAKSGPLKPSFTCRALTRSPRREEPRHILLRRQSPERVGSISPRLNAREHLEARTAAKRRSELLRVIVVTTRRP